MERLALFVKILLFPILFPIVLLCALLGFLWQLMCCAFDEGRDMLYDFQEWGT